MSFEGLGKMFESEFVDVCNKKFPLVLMGGRAEGLACADPGARTPIGASRIIGPSGAVQTVSDSRRPLF